MRNKLELFLMIALFIAFDVLLLLGYYIDGGFTLTFYIMSMITSIVTSVGIVLIIQIK